MVTNNSHKNGNNDNNNEDLPDFSDPEDYVDDIPNEGKNVFKDYNFMVILN